MLELAMRRISRINNEARSEVNIFRTYSYFVLNVLLLSVETTIIKAE